MREILFRGSMGNGKWVYGGFLHGKRKTALICSNKTAIPFEVIPETVGQYTGLEDKNDVKIFEGDIVEAVEINGKQIAPITFRKGFFIVDGKFGLLRIGVGVYKRQQLKVIGNIFDNPELLKGGESNE